MKLFKFDRPRGSDVYINPDSVAYIADNKGQNTIIIFNTSNNENQERIVVNDKLDVVARKLSDNDIKTL